MAGAMKKLYEHLPEGAVALQLKNLRLVSSTMCHHHATRTCTESACCLGKNTECARYAGCPNNNQGVV